MFTFNRTHSGPAEVWTITVAAKALPDAASRFGTPLRNNARDSSGEERPSHFHEVGIVVALEMGVDETEFLLACKEGLTEAEKRTLLVELEMLLGRQVYGWGAEESRGFFLHDSLRSCT